MKRLAAALALLGLLFAAKPLLAQDEATIKGAFIMCGPQRVLIACDDLVKMPDLNNVVRSNAYVTRAGTLLSLGQMDAAKADVDKALALDPTNSVALQARTLLQQAKPAAGEKLTFDACLHATDSNSRLKACDGFVTSQAFDKAREAAALEMRAKALIDAGRFNDALADLDKADQLAPDRQDGALHRIMALTLSGDYAKALSKAKAAVADSIVQDENLLGAEGELLYLTGDREGAVKAYDAAYKANEKTVMAKFWSAIIRQELHQTAIADLRALLTHPMMSPLGAAIIRLRLHETGQAPVLKEAQLSGPTAPCIAYFNIGHDAWLRGDLTAARAALQQAVDSGQADLREYRAAKLLLSKLKA
jgi:tetratricopeptide (TPR) repeat protein